MRDDHGSTALPRRSLFSRVVLSLSAVVVAVLLLLPLLGGSEDGGDTISRAPPKVSAMIRCLTACAMCWRGGCVWSMLPPL